jgi:hypothetical protein
MKGGFDFFEGFLFGGGDRGEVKPADNTGLIGTVELLFLGVRRRAFAGL